MFIGQSREPYEHHVFREYSVLAVIGKGGMGKKTLAPLEECGAALYYARSPDKVLGVPLLDTCERLLQAARPTRCVALDFSLSGMAQ